MAKFDKKTGLPAVDKQPAELRLYDVNVTQYMRTGDTISSVGTEIITNLGRVSGSTSLGTTGYTHNSSAILQFKAKAGTGTSKEGYKVTLPFTTVAGDTLHAEVVVLVRDL